MVVVVVVVLVGLARLRDLFGGVGCEYGCVSENHDRAYNRPKQGERRFASELRQQFTVYVSAHETVVKGVNAGSVTHARWVRVGRTSTVLFLIAAARRGEL